MFSLKFANLQNCNVCHCHQQETHFQLINLKYKNSIFQEEKKNVLNSLRLHCDNHAACVNKSPHLKVINALYSASILHLKPQN